MLWKERVEHETNAQETHPPAVRRHEPGPAHHPAARCIGGEPLYDGYEVDSNQDLEIDADDFYDFFDHLINANV